MQTHALHINHCVPIVRLFRWLRSSLFTILWPLAKLYHRAYILSCSDTYIHTAPVSILSEQTFLGLNEHTSWTTPSQLLDNSLPNPLWSPEKHTQNLIVNQMTTNTNTYSSYMLCSSHLRPIVKLRNQAAIHAKGMWPPIEELDMGCFLSKNSTVEQKYTC